MVVIIEDKKIRKVGLTSIEVDLIIESLESQSYGIVKFYGEIFKDLIKKMEKLR